VLVIVSQSIPEGQIKVETVNHTSSSSSSSKTKTTTTTTKERVFFPPHASSYMGFIRTSLMQIV